MYELVRSDTQLVDARARARAPTHAEMHSTSSRISVYMRARVPMYVCM